MTWMVQREFLKSLRRWHRLLGLVLAVPLVVLACTGILLNHSDDLRLNQRYLSSSLLHSWYRINPLKAPQSLKAGDVWISLIDHSLYLDRRRAAENVTAINAAEVWEDTLVVSSPTALYLFDPTNLELIEKIGPENLPPGSVLAIAPQGDRLQIDLSSGRYSADRDLTNFQLENRAALHVAQPQSPPRHLVDDLLADWRTRGLSLWRFLMDLHTGRFFTTLSKPALDLAGLLTLVLVGSGFYISRRLPRK